MGKCSHCPQALYFTAEIVSFHCGFGYQSFSTTCENCFSQISTKVTYDSAETTTALCSRWGADEPQTFLNLSILQNEHKSRKTAFLVSQGEGDFQLLSKVLALYSCMESFKLNLKQDKNQIETFRNYSQNSKP